MLIAPLVTIAGSGISVDVHQQTDKEKVAHIHNGILFSCNEK